MSQDQRRFIWLGPRVALVSIVLVLAGCGASSSPMPSVPPTAAPSPAATQQPGGSTPIYAAPWEAAGESAFELHDYFHAVPLDAGRALVVGSRDSGAVAELWDPVSVAWRPTEPLNKPRYAFAAVPLRDGRVLVAGGLNAGIGSDHADRQSFSSAYVFDPSPGQEHWTKVGLMAWARTAPAAALLPDGRVLVAGGYYYTGTSGSRTAPESTTEVVELAAYQATPAAEPRPTQPPSQDAEPDPYGFALATAELFDPATGQWSTTGSMHFARAGAAAATLPDGRVLVVGAGGYTVTDQQEGVFDTAEIYDPASGRFSFIGSLPAIDVEAVAELGIRLPDGRGQPWANGTLVALDDGGAILVGNTRWWKHQGDATRMLRFDARTETWSEVGQTWASGYSEDRSEYLATPGVRRLHALAASLADGRVLVAGGDSGGPEYTGTVTASAELYEPATGTWTALPDMPIARADGEAVLLSDGSVLLVGGYGPDGFARTAIRMVP